MGKLLVVSDLHLSNKPNDQYRWDTLCQIEEEFKSGPYEALLILGDLCTEKDRHCSQLVNEIVGFIRQMAALKRVYILMGNHDYIERRYPFWSFLGLIPNVTYIQKSGVHRIDEFECYFIPHTKKFQDELTVASSCGTVFDLMLLHQTFEGSLVNKTFKLPGLPATTRFPAQLVLSGDVHMPQIVGRVMYVGSPYPTTFGEEHTGQMLVVEKVSGEPWVSSLPLDHIRKVTIGISCLAQLADIDLHMGDHVKVQVSLRRSEFGSWLEMKQAIINWAEDKSVHLYGVTMVPVKERERVRLTNTPAKIVGGTTEVFDQFCNLNSHAGNLRKVGMELVAKVS